MLAKLLSQSAEFGVNGSATARRCRTLRDQWHSMERLDDRKTGWIESGQCTVCSKTKSGKPYFRSRSSSHLTPSTESPTNLLLDFRDGTMLWKPCGRPGYTSTFVLMPSSSLIRRSKMRASSLNGSCPPAQTLASPQKE